MFPDVPLIVADVYRMLTDISDVTTAWATPGFAKLDVFARAMSPPPLSEPSRIAIEDALTDALNALVESPALDEPHTWHVAYLG